MPAQPPHPASGSTTSTAPTRQLTLTHFGHGVKRAHSGGSRHKTPMRAQKILRRMDEGFERGKKKQQDEDDERTRAAGGSVGERGGQAEDLQHRCKESSGGDVAREERIDTTESLPASEPALALRKASYRPRPGSRPKQAYLTGSETTAVEAPPGPASLLPSDAAYSEPKETASATAPTTTPRPAPPPVPIFSVSAKKQIHSLTSESALKDSSNPITHSTTGHGTMHYQSASTGHQQANRVTASGRGPFSSSGQWWASRMTKIRAQLEDNAKVGAVPVAGASDTSHGASKSDPESSNAASTPSPCSNIFHGCRVYINGYVGTKVGNKELMRLLVQHGARVDYLPNGGTTHIVSEMALSAKKREEMLSMKRLGLVKRFVRVDWILDSIDALRRKPEHLYAHPIPVQRGVADMLSSASSDASSASKTDEQVDKRKATSTPLLARTTQASSPASSSNSAAKSSKGTAASILDWRAEARRLAADAAMLGKPRGCSG